MELSRAREFGPKLGPAALALLAIIFCAVLSAAAQSAWVPLGPEGGDVRSLAYDPQNPERIYLGTSAGQLYLSNDGGASWSRYARMGSGDDYVLDNIAIDPSDHNTVYVAAWSVEREGGDLFRSKDGGRSWQAVPGMAGKSIRALELAPSNPKIIVAGALDGVWRSDDAGNSWRLISPQRHADIKNIESVAIDPRNPDVVFAGTWHLPWKTLDGGRTWSNVKQGIIDDSDVFSIIIDQANPAVMYVSACSGIYKSESAGVQFKKAQGMPFSARRTRVLHQDPSNPAVVYAGTTEGLWRTSDAGATWKRVTSPNVIVNDVLVDPRRPQRVLLATDRGGVLASNDGAQTFVASNRGFAHRQVSSLLVEKSDPQTIFAGIVNNREFGTVYVSRDGGSQWQSSSDGLNGRDVFTLAQASNGSLLAGTNRGVYELPRGQRVWRPINAVVKGKIVSVPAKSKSKKSKPTTKVTYIKSELSARVAQVEAADGQWLAATSAGLYTSKDNGKSWTGGPVLGEQNFVAVDELDKLVIAATLRRVVYSNNAGESWSAVSIPTFISVVFGVAVSPGPVMWINTREGVFRSSDMGGNWEHVFVGGPPRNLRYVAYDGELRRMLGIAYGSGEVYESADGRTWRRVSEAGYRLRSVASAGGRLFASTAFDGIVAQGEVRGRSLPTTAGGGGGAGPQR